MASTLTLRLSKLPALSTSAPRKVRNPGYRDSHCELHSERYAGLEKARFRRRHGPLRDLFPSTPIGAVTVLGQATPTGLLNVLD